MKLINEAKLKRPVRNKKTVRTSPSTKISREEFDNSLDLIRSVIRRPLGTDPERDKKIMAAWGVKG